MTLDGHWKSIQATRPGKNSGMGQCNPIPHWEKPSEQERMEEGIKCQTRFQSHHHHHVGRWLYTTHLGQMGLNFLFCKMKELSKIVSTDLYNAFTLCVFMTDSAAFLSFRNISDTDMANFAIYFANFRDIGACVHFFKFNN